jgi:hypothetical protein
MTSVRVVIPELLDNLPPDDPRAIASRRDLVRINKMMRQTAIMATALGQYPVPKNLADMGGGDGKFLLQVARRMAKRWPGVRAVILDRQNIVSAETRAGFAALGWSCDVMKGDVFDTLPRLSPDIAIANLFLHHFDDAKLAKLLAVLAANCRGVVASEPRRSGFALLGARLVFALGANGITRHDAVASVRAGFAGQEISALWPTHADARWRNGECGVFPFSHIFLAGHV